jgi:hypothetical protein
MKNQIKYQFFHNKRKFITAFACTTVGIQTILFSDFDHIEGVSDGGGGNKFVGKPHIFTNIQKDFQNFIDINIYGIQNVDARKAIESTNKNTDTTILSTTNHDTATTISTNNNTQKER